MNKLLLICLLCIPLLSSGAIYKHINPDGTIIYSDRPIAGAEPVKLPAGSGYTAPTSPTLTTPTSVNDTESTLLTPATTAYTNFNIASPKGDEVTFQNTRQIPVLIDIEPELKEGDKIQLYVDNQPYGEPKDSLSFTLEDLERGEHVLEARLLGQNSQLLKTSRSITLYIHYASRPQPSPAQPLLLPVTPVPQPIQPAN